MRHLLVIIIIIIIIVMDIWIYGYMDIAPGKADRNWQLTCRDVKSSAKRKPATHSPRRACREIASNLRREDEKKAP